MVNVSRDLIVIKVNMVIIFGVCFQDGRPLASAPSPASCRSPVCPAAPSERTPSPRAPRGSPRTGSSPAPCGPALGRWSGTRGSCPWWCGSLEESTSNVSMFKKSNPNPNSKSNPNSNPKPSSNPNPNPYPNPNSNHSWLELSGGLCRG